MARRIVLTMIALIGALLVTAVVPLGLITTGHERSSFRQDTTLTAETLAGVAEERLDKPPVGTMTRTLAEARRIGEQVQVYDAAGRVVAGTGGTDLGVAAATLAAALRGRTVVANPADDRLRVVVP